MPLKVLSVAFPFAPVGPCGVGGAEQILSDLDEALVSAGHSSTVIACAGSETAGRLIAVALPVTYAEAEQRACRASVQAAIDEVLAAERPDLVHMHGLDFHQYALPEDVPVVVTLHLPIAWYPEHAWTRLRGPRQFCCVSESQRRTCPPELHDAVVIENGVAILPPVAPRREKAYALVLGRICPEKNAHEALEAGTKAGIPVYVAGRVFGYRSHQEYFEERMAPLFDREANGVQHRFLGVVEPGEREELLAGARCLLHPTLAPETSSLAAMEALAARVPVVAYRSGALPEIVEDGVTGFLVNTVDEMAEAMGRVGRISPEACRAVARRRFSKERMVRSYLGMYQRLLQRARAEVLHA